MKQEEVGATIQPSDLLMSITGLLGIIIGCFLCVIVVGLPLGIPMIIGGMFFRRASVMTKDELQLNRGKMLGWTIYMSIAGFPVLTVLTILSYRKLGGK